MREKKKVRKDKRVVIEREYDDISDCLNAIEWCEKLKLRWIAEEPTDGMFVVKILQDEDWKREAA